MRFAAIGVLCLIGVSCGGGSGTGSPTAPTSSSAATRIISIEGTLAFGDVRLGQTAELVLTIRNNGNATLTLGDVTAPASIASLVSITGSSRTVAPGATATLTFRFTPTATGAVSGTITINADHTSGTNTVTLTAVGVGVPVTVTGVVTDAESRRPVGGVRVAALTNNAALQNLATATTDGNGFYSMVVPSGTAISLQFSRDGYNFQSSTVTFTTDTRRDVSLNPLWTRTGTGNTVFDMPTYVRRVRIVGTYSASGSNFIVWVGNRLVVNEIIGTARQGGPRYEGVHAVIGGEVRIENSRDVVWSFTQEP
jgi:hypothetical protein